MGQVLTEDFNGNHDFLLEIESQKHGLRMIFESVGLQKCFQTLGIHRDSVLDIYEKVINLLFFNSIFCQGIFSFFLSWIKNPPFQIY